MKRNTGISLVLALLLSLAACSQTGKSEPTVITTAETVASETTAQPVDVQNGVYRVSNTAELLEAIGPDREIRLAAGTYDFADATGHGPHTDNPYVLWQETYDGEELVIHDVENLTILGEGQGVSILATHPRYANVLVFRNCKNLFLSGITAGHTPEPGACVGGVVYLEQCRDVSIRNVGLYGCGVTGVTAESCNRVSVVNSDIYSCSYNGVQVTNSQDVQINNCHLFELGEAEWDAFEVFNLHNSSDVTISDCEIYNNNVYCLVRSSGVDGVTLKNNVFRNNTVREFAFGTFGNFVTMDGNVIEGNSIHRWFDAGCGAVDAEGNTINEDSMNGIVPEEPSVPQEKVTVTVSNVDDFLAAIAPNREIVLDGALFDFTQAADYGGGPQNYYRWEENFDGYSLVIVGADNLTIRNKAGNRANCVLATQPRYADVLTFRHCENLVLSGFTAGHTKEQGECTGGVLYLDNCLHAAIQNCGMYGCGILGVQAVDCTDITIQNCEIYECTYGGIQMMGVTGLVIENCAFRDLGGNNIRLDDCSDVTVDGAYINGQHYDGR